jgi:hypothetical protein
VLLEANTKTHQFKLINGDIHDNVGLLDFQQFCGLIKSRSKLARFLLRSMALCLTARPPKSCTHPVIRASGAIQVRSGLLTYRV